MTTIRPIPPEPLAVELADAETIRPDLDQGSAFAVTLGGDRILAGPSGVVQDGRQFTLRVTQDDAGGHRLGYDGAYQFHGRVQYRPVPQLAAAAGAATELMFTRIGGAQAGHWRLVREA